MKPAPVDYVRPTTLVGACAELAADGAKVLAGGQSLVPLLSIRLAAPRLLVDLGGLPDLDRIDVTDEGVRVGALVRHSDLLADGEARRAQPLLARALRHVAHPTIRNRGTTVGSLVHADSAAEMPAVLLLLDGWVEVVSQRGSRRIAAADLVVGPLESSLATDEICVAATFPALRPGCGVAFDEIARRQGDYAICGVATLVECDPAGAILSARAGLLAVADTPVVVDLSAALAGAVDPSPALFDAAAGLVATAVDPAADLHASADYRGQLLRVLIARVTRAAYDDAVERAGVPA
jgi:carbon-monoxide dehydrogenase medium subunit